MMYSIITGVAIGDSGLCPRIVSHREIDLA
jgi:hypothetical protein